MEPQNNPQIPPNAPQTTPILEAAKAMEVSVVPPVDPSPSDVSIPEPEIAYTVKDKSFILPIRKSLNAWWMDSEKVRDLIACLKNGFEVQDALHYAGISYGQWEYFKERHPEFSEVRKACESIAFQLAEKSSIEGLKKGDLPHTRWFLERRRPEKYGPVDAMVPPVGTNFGTIVNNTVNIREVKPSVLKAVLEREKQNGTHPTSAPAV